MNLMTRLLVGAVAVLPAATGCAVGAEDTSDPSSAPEPAASAESPLYRSGGLGAKGDACTVRTGVPGTENDSGECCSNTDSKDCVIILKPFPGSFTAKW